MQVSTKTMAFFFVVVALGMFSFSLTGCGGPAPGTCKTDAVGSCKLFGCDKSHGPTDCVKGACVCSGDTCSLDGKCVAPADVPADEDAPDDAATQLDVMSATYDASCTGSCVETCHGAECDQGTTKHCYIFGQGCHANSHCNSEKQCQCGDGYCSDGAQDCVANTKMSCSSCFKPVGSCRVFGCSASHGETECVKGVCLCSGDTCSSGGKCVDAADVPTQEYDVTDAPQLDIKSAARKTAHVAEWTLGIFVVGGCLCTVGIFYGIYALFCKEADGRQLEEPLMLA